jgi:hypothetical protein
MKDDSISQIEFLNSKLQSQDNEQAWEQKESISWKMQNIHVLLERHTIKICPFGCVTCASKAVQ